ncbi:MAG: 30S ribosomal protein S6 [Patescibacteria group bacterium]|nr:30S ribosomal protein S6 [Patescibacteria group bacterium]
MEIIEDNQTKKYELTCIVPAGYTKSELDKLQSGLTDFLKEKGAKIEEEVTWGKRELAYTIRKQGKAFSEGNYFHWVFSAEPNDISDLRKGLNLRDEIVRKLLVVVE